MLDNTLISIIIPIYNVENYIKLCLDSIILLNNKTSLSQIEIIGVDDCSPDTSAIIFKQYIKKYPNVNIKIITHSENKGLGGARNTGIKNAKGKYLFFLDSDDWLNDGSINFLVKSLKNKSKKSILIFGFHSKRNDKVEWSFIPSKKETISQDEALKLFASDKITPSACNKVFPSEIFNEISFKEQLYYEDLEFTPRAFKRVKHIDFTTEILFNYRLEGVSITKQKTKQKHIDDLTKVLEHLYADLKEEYLFLFSEIFCNRWNYLLKIWDLSDNLKIYALNNLLGFISKKNIPLNHKKADDLFLFINEKFNTSDFNYEFIQIKENVLQILNELPEGDMLLEAVFDKIYVVNLKEELKNRFSVSKQLKDRKIDFEFWNATNGYLEENKTQYINYINRGVGQLKRFNQYSNLEKYRGRKFIESPGAFGYIQTYISILKDAKKKKYKSILILEDDVILVDYFEKKAQAFLNSISNTWKIVQFGASQYGWDEIDIDEAKKNGFYHPLELKTCGSFAIGLHESIFDELIKVQSYFDAPFDHIPLGTLFTKYSENSFVAFPNICIPDVSSSSIREGRDQFLHGKKMLWSLSKYKFPPRKYSIAIILNSKLNLKYIDLLSTDLNSIFDVRWFLNTNNGFRPIHQNEYLDSSKIEIKDNIIKNDNINLASDFILSINPELLVNTELICEKIFNHLKLKVTNQKKGNLIHTKSFDRIELHTTKNEQNYQKGLVSIIIPTYKRSDNLVHAINSLIDQTYDLIEVVVVDDNGIGTEEQKNTELIINQIQKSFPIKYITHKSNLNGAAARNTGLLNSNGEYISFLDDDDIYFPEKVEKSIQVLKKLPEEFAAVYCGYKGWNSKSNDLNRYKEGDLTYDLLSLNFISHYLHTNTATYRRSALEAINGFDETFNRHQDLEFNIRFFDKYKIGVVKELLVELNPRPSKTSNKVRNSKMFVLKEKFLKRFESKIKTFSKLEQQIIYKNNWSEAVVFFESQESFLEYFDSREDLTSINELYKLVKTTNDNIESKAILPSNNINQSNDLEDRKNLEIMLTNKNQTLIKELSSVQIKLKLINDNYSKLELERNWYGRTYDHLPWWFLKIGSIFRRVKVKKGF